MKFFTLVPLIILIEIFYGMGITARTTPSPAVAHSVQPVSFLALLSQQSSRLLAQAIDASPEPDSAPTTTPEGANQSPASQAIDPAVADSATPANTPSSDTPTPPSDTPSAVTSTATIPTDTASSDTSAQIPIVSDAPATSSKDISLTIPTVTDIASPDAVIPALPVSQDVVAVAQQETAAVENAPSTVEKSNLIVAFADNTVNEITTLTQNNDYSTAGYALQQLSDQVTALATAQPAVQNTAVSEKIQAFKQEADSSLRTAQLVLPENQEQEAEIIRGKLLGL